MANVTPLLETYYPVVNCPEPCGHSFVPAPAAVRNEHTEKPLLDTCWLPIALPVTCPSCGCVLMEGEANL